MAQWDIRSRNSAPSRALKAGWAVVTSATIVASADCTTILTKVLNTTHSSRSPGVALYGIVGHPQEMWARENPHCSTFPPRETVVRSVLGSQGTSSTLLPTLKKAMDSVSTWSAHTWAASATASPAIFLMDP